MKVLRIKSELGKRCITQTELAERCGLKVQAVNRIVNGFERPFSRAEKIARAIGYEGDPSDLFQEIEVD